MVVLFSLILALGMLVDNAIVLVENIYRHAEEGADLITASIKGTQEVSGAVIASTATTVGAFLPLVVWTGIMGQFMGYLPKTVIIVLVSSLVVAIVILPVFTAKLMKVTARTDVREGGEIKRADNPVLRAYKAMLNASIRHRYISAALVTGMLVATFVAYGVLNHGVEFFPSTQPDAATVSVRAPDGTDLEETDRIVRQIEAVLEKEENIDTFVAEVGVAGGGDPIQGAQAAANMARITIDFLPHETQAQPDEKPRVESTFDTIDRLRGALVEIVGAKITVEKQEMGPPVGAKIGVEVHGDSFHEVGEIAARVRRDIAEIEGATDLRDDYRVGRPEMRLRIDRGAAKRVGASTQAVAGAVRTAVAGTKASTLRDGEDEYDITVELAPRYKDDLQSVLSLRIPGRIDTSPDTFAVPLSSVARYELAGGSGSIRHIDQDLVVTINGDVLDGYNENEVRQKVGAYIEEANPDLPSGYKLRMGGADEEQKNASEFLAGAFQVAVFLIAIVLVTQFNSFTVPTIILGTVVLSLVGVLWGLILTGTPFGIIMTGLGVISLAGVVVNNAIVLLDYVQQLRKEGHTVHDALVQAGLVRFRPVMLTAITTILGLVPMATGVAIDFSTISLSPLHGPKLVIGSSSADWWGPMAVAVIFGLAFATLLTLVMVPTFYSIVEDVRLFFSRIANAVKGRTSPKPAE
jgi:multidrug efflux pump subunit AcrB